MLFQVLLESQQMGSDVPGALINLVVALAAEAKPVASWFNLKRMTPEQGFPVYRQQHIALVVAGPGKVNAAAATAYLFALAGCPANAIWVNVGIAGHPSRAVGETVLAHRITDEASARHWYPPLAARAPCPTESLITLERPDFAYDRPAALDMEAAGFYPTACRFTTSELVQCLKVVSDNRDKPGHRIDAKLVYQLIGESLDTLDALLERLGNLANLLYEIRVPDEIWQHYQHHWNFTATQQHQLRDLLSRWQTLERTDMLWRPEFRRVQSGKELLRQLRTYVDNLRLELE